MPAGIFINYRRQDTLREARAIYERLRAEFGAGQVFIDLEGLDYGEDFEKSLERQLQHCRVLLALIGPGWLDARDGHGHRRLDEENDFVRIELRAALARDIRVVPVLLDGALLPRSTDLPEELRPLLRRHALELRFQRFDADVADLFKSLRFVLDGTADLHRTPSPSRIPQYGSPPAPATRQAEALLPPHKHTDVPSSEVSPPNQWRASAAAAVLVAGLLLLAWVVNKVTAPASVPALAALRALPTDGASIKVENAIVKFYFAAGSARLATGADVALADVVRGIGDGKKAVVSGFHSAIGDPALNAELAKQRTMVVREFLMSLGVAEDKIELKKPEEVADGGSSAKARRVEVMLR